MVSPLQTILIAEDNESDALLLQRSLARSQILNPVQIVIDGEEAINYLAGNGIYADREKYPLPGCIICDLNMPRKNGFEVLSWRRNDPRCAIIPIIVWSGSRLESDVRVAYRLGANAYFVKPPGGEPLDKLIRQILEFWNSAERPEPVSQGHS